MTYTAPAVVIDNGSYTTKAGFSLEDLPSLVFNSNYMKHDKTQQVIIGDELMENNSEQQVMKLLDDGLIYDFDNIVYNWQYVFDNVDNNNPINSSEFPLVVTEQPWNTSKNKVNSCQVAFETLQVPIFSLVKNSISTVVPMWQVNRIGDRYRIQCNQCDTNLGWGYSAEMFLPFKICRRFCEFTCFKLFGE